MNSASGQNWFGKAGMWEGEYFAILIWSPAFLKRGDCEGGRGAESEFYEFYALNTRVLWALFSSNRTSVTFVHCNAIRMDFIFWAVCIILKNNYYVYIYYVLLSPCREMCTTPRLYLLLLINAKSQKITSTEDNRQVKSSMASKNFL